MEYGKVDDEIAQGMDATACAEAILAGLRKGKPEIAMGGKLEMRTLLMKRLYPRFVFRKVAAMAG